MVTPELRLFATTSPPHPQGWRRSSSGELQAWPADVSYGPRLLKADLPGGSPRERRDYRLGWYTSNVVPWLDRVHTELAADELGCAARYSVWTGRCCVCARRLQSSPEHLVGACVGCTHRLPHDTVSGLVNAVRAEG